MSSIYIFAIILFILLCVLLCMVILAQESKSTGLGSSFGGDAGSSVFGTSTADVLRKFTTWLVAAFLISCVLLSIWTTGLGRTDRSTAAYMIEAEG